MFIHRLKGTTKSKYQDLGEYKPEEEAALTIQEFSARLYEWVCCIYHNTPDRVTGKTPLECWQQNIHISDIRLPSDYAAVERLVAKTTQLALSKGPLVLDGISYTSSELGDLRKVIGIGARVKVRYSDENLRFIEVINPITKQAFCVPAEDPHYTDGLSRHMHRLVRTHVRENYKAKKGSPDLMEARIALAKKIEEGVKGGKGLRRKMRLQAKAISSENPDGHSLLPQANSPTSAHSFKWKASSDVITGFGRE